MTEDLESELFTDEPVEMADLEPVAIEPVEEVPPVEAEAAEPEAEVEPPVAEHQRPDPGFVPISALMDERDRRKQAEERARQFEQQQGQQPPNPYDDPEGFAAHQQQMVEERLTQERFAMSDMFARERHGDETVETAVKWAQERAQADPSFAMSYMRHQNPIDWIVQQHKRDALLSDIGDPAKLDDWFAREAAKRGYAAPNAPVATAASVAVQPKPAVPPVRVPRSLASQGSGPSDIRDVATGPLAAVDAVFTQ